MPTSATAARGDDALRALRTSFGRRQPEYHGEFYDYEGVLVDPCGVQQTVPLWIGGRTARSLRRAVELADGWAPFGLSIDDETALLERVRSTDTWARRQEATDLPPFEVVLPVGRLLDPLDDPDAATGAADPARDRGDDGERELPAPLAAALRRAARSSRGTCPRRSDSRASVGRDDRFEVAGGDGRELGDRA